MVVKEKVRNDMKKKKIKAFQLERNGAPTASVGSEGYTPPMKMDGYQNKGVAGRAFCNYLKRKGMDGGNKVLLAGSRLSGRFSGSEELAPKGSE
jgi:hypothetical protein